MDDEQCDYQKYGGQEMNILGKFWIAFLFVHILLMSLIKGFSYFN